MLGSIPANKRVLGLGATAAALLVAALVAVPIVDDDGAPPSSDVASTSREADTAGVPGAGTPADTDTAAAPGGSAARPGAARGGQPASGPGAPPGAAPGNVPLTATDRGVTATSIKLGILLLNVGNVERLGVAVGVDPEQQERAWRAYIDEANQRGVAGRKIAPVFRQFDVTSNDSQRAACIAMTEDEKVFTVLDIALNAANALCVADEHDTPLITLQPMPADSYVRSEGRLVTLFSEGSRMWRNVAHDMHAQGLLKGRTIGILSNTAPGNPATMDAFTAELRALGYKVAYRGNLPSDGSAAQLPQASSRIPIEVRGMQTNNVDLIFLSTDTLTATQFVQQADGQRYHPKYYATDWQNAYSDTYVQNMPDSFDGTLITTNRTGEYRPPRPRPEPSTETSCRSIYEKRTGDTLERNTIEYNSTVRLCSILEVFTRGATAAGAGLTRRSLSEGTAAIGVLPLATFGGGSFRPGKQDAADLIRTARFNRACAGGSPNRCWLPVDDFRAPRYQ